MKFIFKTYVTLRTQSHSLDMIQLNKPISSRNILSLCLKLFCPNSVKIERSEAIEALYRRELRSSTAIGFCAIPHGEVFSAGNTILTLIGKFPTPVNWPDNPYPSSVSIVGIILFPPPAVHIYLNAMAAFSDFIIDVRDGIAKTDEQYLKSIHKYFDKLGEVQIL